jgi:AAA+ ATPase superfamily predicted ATPase
MVESLPSGPILVNREQERDELRRLLTLSEPRLALLTGRRRIGKTYLSTHAWEPEPIFLFTAARTTAELNRRQLILDLARWAGEDLRLEDLYVAA